MPHHSTVFRGDVNSTANLDGAFLDALDPDAGEGSLESVAFFASTPIALFAEADALRESLGCSALNAIRMAMAVGLLRPPTPTLIPGPEIVKE